MKKIRTLQFQITLVVGILLVAVSIILTVNSIYSANNYYGLLQDYEGESIELLPEIAASEAIYDPELIEEDKVTFADMMISFSVQGLVVMFVTIAVSLLIVYWITGKMLRPLYRLTDSIRIIDEKHLHKRLEKVPSTEEIDQLTRSFNSMMDRLEESFLVQKRFAANAAHELKTPLAVMKTGLQVLKIDDEPSLEDYEEVTDGMEQSLDRLINTVNSLMFLADEGLAEEFESNSLGELLETAVQQLAGKAEEKKVSIYMQCGDSSIIGSQTLLYRMFYNIIENAIKYNKEGGEIYVKAEQKDQTVTVQIKDTGVGMEPEDIKYVFDPFYRADKSRSQQIQGSGLGMSIVKLIVERCRGDIRIESEPDAGTTVEVQLPVNTAGTEK
ncbi:sensor histidine kinase [Murimonas intestini]|uniref:histidine kinase n=1 Tax=Murimonas intestini TaxID=1337051 RepID=A0AB73T3W3_9FIRM|nr:HAMP domain-containing sensor histidine kinase [Murimonas intestini]MCR1841608.1 HAMP domain-containing histidine kinase [Murimonas intestini]MCR1868494.1 HAMP domain-containing histidine kinase [Murimonas intestini]MCR1886095.1 HAMP domain-containing histidine kinase [Murimonas intestini]